MFQWQGETKALTLNLMPGDVCVYTMRAQCGAPGFEVTSTQSMSSINIYSMDYDDDDLGVRVNIVKAINDSFDLSVVGVPQKNIPFGVTDAIANSNGYLNATIHRGTFADGTTKYFARMNPDTLGFEVFQSDSKKKYYLPDTLSIKDFTKATWTSNPFNGYTYAMEPVNGAVNARVVFTNGTNKIYPSDPLKTYSFNVNGGYSVQYFNLVSQYSYGNFITSPAVPNNLAYAYQDKVGIQWSDGTCGYTRYLAPKESVILKCANGTTRYFPYIGHVSPFDNSATPVQYT